MAKLITVLALVLLLVNSFIYAPPGGYARIAGNDSYFTLQPLTGTTTNTSAHIPSQQRPHNADEENSLFDVLLSADYCMHSAGLSVKKPYSASADASIRSYDERMQSVEYLSIQSPPPEIAISF